MSLGENLKQLRKDKNLSQEQLAEKLNVSRQAVSKWESDKAYPDIDNLILLKDIFNVTLDDLVLGECNTDYKLENKVIQEENNAFDIKKEHFIPEMEYNEEFSETLIIGGFIIGMGFGFITNNFILGTAGAFIGMGIGFFIETIKKLNKSRQK